VKRFRNCCETSVNGLADAIYGARRQVRLTKIGERVRIFPEPGQWACLPGDEAEIYVS
jgi:hypothetical protein